MNSRRPKLNKKGLDRTRPSCWHKAPTRKSTGNYICLVTYKNEMGQLHNVTISIPKDKNFEQNLEGTLNIFETDGCKIIATQDIAY